MQKCKDMIGRSHKSGQKIGMETPFCRQIAEIVHGVENELYETFDENMDFFQV